MEAPCLSTDLSTWLLTFILAEIKYFSRSASILEQNGINIFLPHLEYK